MEPLYHQHTGVSRDLQPIPVVKAKDDTDTRLCSICKRHPWQHILIMSATVAPMLCRGCRNTLMGAKVG